MSDRPGLYLMLLSVHGLVRGDAMELGRDADTGGQVTYVVELARALAKRPDVARVDLVTRRIVDQHYDAAYAEPIEDLGDGARIVRIECGPRRYLNKESLWPYLDQFVDNVTTYLRAEGQAPDLVHGHYADAGYVAARLSALLNVPLAFTGHSLGRDKRRRLLDGGSKPEVLERRYKISRRIDAEEDVLENAAFVVASTNQEVEQQYERYDHYRPQSMTVIPPGVDLSRFAPPDEAFTDDLPIHQEVDRFLRDPHKPMILAIARPDPRKNLPGLVRAYARNRALREAANLVLVVGNRDDIRKASRPVRSLMTKLFYLIDRYDLYGSVSYPKHHRPEDVPDLYRLAASRRGVFVNPALTEPFGLTLIEAAAAGLPIVATEDGGPQEIVARCENGLLVDPLDPKALGQALLRAVTDDAAWDRWSKQGLRGVHANYTWEGHASRYLERVEQAVEAPRSRTSAFSVRRRLFTADRILASDIDNTLIGNEAGLAKLVERLDHAGGNVAFAIATGRSLDLTLRAFREWDIPTPTVLITSVGSEIHYGPNLVRDEGWFDRIRYRWQPDAIREAMKGIPGLQLQPPEGQGEFKVSYFLDPESVPPTAEIKRHLRRSKLSVKVIRSHDAYLDVLPVRASKGLALRYLAVKWHLPSERILAAGDSGNDEEMLVGNNLGVVVGNHDPEMEHLRGMPRIYFAEGPHAWGILEGIDHYDFLGSIRIPEPAVVE